MKDARAFAARAIPTNASAPTPLLLGEALDHIRQIRLLKAFDDTVILIGIGILLAIGFWAWPSAVITLVSGSALSLSTLVAIYILWYGRFLDRNNEFGILCPRCTSRMWQVCCTRCSEPVPALVLMLRGALLSACPHCDQHLSCADDTLRAWCSTCSHTVPRPDLFYRKPMYLIVCAVDHLPDVSEVGGDWQLTAHPSPSRTILCHRSDSHSSCLLLLVDYLKETSFHFDPHLVERHRLLLASKRIPQPFVEQFRAKFPRRFLIV